MGADADTGLDLVEMAEGCVLKIANLVHDAPRHKGVKVALMREIRRADGRREMTLKNAVPQSQAWLRLNDDLMGQGERLSG